MVLNRIFNWLKVKYKQDYVISTAQQKEMLEHNQKMIPIISILLMLFGGINFVAVHMTSTGNFAYVKSLLIYYFCIFFFSLINFCLNLLFKQHKNWKLFVRNIPVYFLYVSCLGAELYIALSIDNVFDAFAIFACLITISQLLVHIEPVFYSTLILTAALLQAPKIYSVLGLSSAADLILYTVIVSLFSFNRWKTLKANYESDKKIKEHAEAIDKELDLASNVQQSFYTHKKQDLNNWEIEFYSKPIAGVTGDLFDIYTYNKNLQGFCLFDVSGHGVSAGLVTMLVRNIIRRQFYDTESKYLEQTMFNINSEFEKTRGKINNYMSGILFKISGDTVEFVNAAHPNPIIYKKSENKVKIYDDPNDARGTAIGISYVRPQFFSDFIEVAKGDEIILYTDGITEAKNEAREEFGYERFQTVLQNNIKKSLKGQISALTTALAEFTGNKPAEDDITILILRRK